MSTKSGAEEEPLPHVVRPRPLGDERLLPGVVIVRAEDATTAVDRSELSRGQAPATTRGGHQDSDPGAVHRTLTSEVQCRPAGLSGTGRAIREARI